LRFLSALAPHVKRATQISARLADAAALERAKTTALDRIDHGVMIVDGNARVLYANRAAESIIARGDGMIVSARVLRGATTTDTQRLHALIADAISGASGGTMRVARPSCTEPFLVLVAPTGSSGHWPVDSAPAAIIFITDPERSPRLELRRLMDLFGLTATEAKVALALADGRGVPEAAHSLRISPNTVHTHLRRIFGKLAVNRQSELVRVLARAAAIEPGIACH
jgi:DNA-binding CsgD family transcriptional regulator